MLPDASVPTGVDATPANVSAWDALLPSQHLTTIQTMTGESQGSVSADGGVRSRVRSCIQESGLAQREFARRIELDETKLSKALRGTRRFSTTELFRIATVGGVTVNWLITGSESASGPAAVPSSSSLPAKVRATPEQARKRQEIVEAGWRLFAAHGVHGVRISEIAAACEVSTAAVYYYFSSKRELFEETLRYSVKLAFDRQVASLHLVSGPAARLAHLVELQLPTPGVRSTEWSIWLQSWSEVAVGAASRENHSDAYRRWYRTVLDLLREGQQEGVFVGAATDDLAIQLTSLIDGLGIKVLIGTISAEEMRSHVLGFIDRVIVIADGSTSDA